MESEKAPSGEPLRGWECSDSSSGHWSHRCVYLITIQGAIHLQMCAFVCIGETSIKRFVSPLSWTELCGPQNMFKSRPPGPQTVSVFGNRVSEVVVGEV